MPLLPIDEELGAAGALAFDVAGLDVAAVAGALLVSAGFASAGFASPPLSFFDEYKSAYQPEPFK